MDGFAVRWRIRSRNMRSETGHLGDRGGAGRESRHENRRPGSGDPHHDRRPIPQGLTAVVKVEETEPRPVGEDVQADEPRGRIFVRRGRRQKGRMHYPKGRRFARRSGDARHSGQVIRAGLSASARGYFSTGDELADLDERFSEEKIINSNSYGIAAAVQEAGGIPILLGIAVDNPAALKEKISQGSECRYSCPFRRGLDG